MVCYVMYFVALNWLVIVYDNDDNDGGICIFVTLKKNYYINKFDLI